MERYKGALATATADATAIGGFVGAKLRACVTALSSLANCLLDKDAWSSADAAQLLQQQRIVVNTPPVLSPMEFVKVEDEAALEKLWKRYLACPNYYGSAPVLDRELENGNGEWHNDGMNQTEAMLDGSGVFHDLMEPKGKVELEDTGVVNAKLCFLCETLTEYYVEIPEEQEARREFLDNLILIDNEERFKAQALMVNRELAYLCYPHCNAIVGPSESAASNFDHSQPLSPLYLSTPTQRPCAAAAEAALAAAQQPSTSSTRSKRGRHTQDYDGQLATTGLSISFVELGEISAKELKQLFAREALSMEHCNFVKNLRTRALGYKRKGQLWKYAKSRAAAGQETVAPVPRRSIDTVDPAPCPSVSGTVPSDGPTSSVCRVTSINTDYGRTNGAYGSP
ncbi:hypothetical protein PFISCL1PPCAC_17530 [Pristionchus fissidentatus]|uniref:Uncharacterized protein n=1 Tax=Pristionchus fissidentatus TaxID=1538716 RepID=A0AAV5W704_9BILA|nr:hypothetical protein PFISCL1PPCAC_17530 [Pristionchus fissidentatus]